MENQVEVTNPDLQALIAASKGGNLFTVNARSAVFGNTTLSNNVPILNVGSTGGHIDILNNFRWKNMGPATEVPYLIATEYELDFGSWTSNLATVLQSANALANNKNLDAYLKLYAGHTTGFNYTFPWLIKDGDNIRTISNTWDKSEGLFKGLVAGVKASNVLQRSVGTVTGAFTPAVGIEEIKEFKETNPEEITISFPLYNTKNVKDAYANYSFVALFTFQNLKTRTSFLTYIPPKLYTLDSYAFGGLYWPICYVSNLKIDSIGTGRVLNDISNYPIIVPEAYKVTITFKQLLANSSNIFAGNMGGEKVQVVGSGFDVVNQFDKGNTTPSSDDVDKSNPE
jgi:hypothetical protein